MANLRQLLAENADMAGGNSDAPQSDGPTGGFQARMPVPTITPGMGGGFDPTAPGIHDFPGASGLTIEPPGASAQQKGQSSESPRERVMTSAPRMPSEPTPQAGAAGPALDASSGVIPFAPMAGSGPEAQVQPQGPAPVSGVSLRGSSLFGSSGGLTGGGLGIPQDPTTRANNGSIDGLIQLIQRLQQGQ